MADTMGSRVARIISGSVNMLIDAVENSAPEAVMAEAVREIDAAVGEVRAELGRAAAGKHLANSRLMDANRRHEDLADQIAIAVKEGRDDLAEAGIAQQMDIEAQIPVLEHAIADANAEERELEGYVLALQAKKREMQDELARYRASTAAAAAPGPDGPGPTPGRGIDEAVRRADSAFDRVLAKRMGTPARPGTPTAQTAAQLAELEDLQRTNRIKERLAAAKASREVT